MLGRTQRNSAYVERRDSAYAERLIAEFSTMYGGVEIQVVNLLTFLRINKKWWPEIEIRATRHGKTISRINFPAASAPAVIEALGMAWNEIPDNGLTTAQEDEYLASLAHGCEVPF